MAGKKEDKKAIRKETKKLRESDLYKPIYDYFKDRGYTVRSEVKDCDITAVKDEELVVVELKLNFNAALLLQAVQRQRVTDYVYVALPHPKRDIYSRNWKNVCHLLRRLELGLILVRFSEETPEMEIIFEPVPFDRTRSRQRGKKLKDSILKEIDGRYEDFNTGGTCRKKLVTAYRECSIQIACCIEMYGSLSPAAMKKLGTCDKTPSILTKNYYNWFERLKRGIYGLSELGRKELQDYPGLVQLYSEKFSGSAS